LTHMKALPFRGKTTFKGLRLSTRRMPGGRLWGERAWVEGVQVGEGNARGRSCGGVKAEASSKGD